MLIDASFGFEMETFEFLNICQVHGFPKIMGVLTHLDSFKHNKQLKKTKQKQSAYKADSVFREFDFLFCFVFELSFLLPKKQHPSMPSL